MHHGPTFSIPLPPAHPLPPTTQVSRLQGRVDYFQKLCGEAQKDVEEWRNK